MGTKLTLSMDEDLIRFAHELAREKNASISSIVADYLRGLRKQQFDASRLHTDVRKLMGVFKGAAIPEMKRELRAQYHEAKVRK